MKALRYGIGFMWIGLIGCSSTGHGDAANEVDAAPPTFDAAPPTFDAAEQPGPDASGDTLVEDLPPTQLEELYQDFIADLCSTADDPPDCRSCIGLVPDDPAFEATMDAECAGVTVEQVHACSAAFAAGQKDTYEICAEGGGCVFDVLDALASDC